MAETSTTKKTDEKPKTPVQMGQHAELENPDPPRYLKKGDANPDGSTVELVSEVDRGGGFPDISKEDLVVARENERAARAAEAENQKALEESTQSRTVDVIRAQEREAKEAAAAEKAKTAPAPAHGSAQETEQKKEVEAEKQ